MPTTPKKLITADTRLKALALFTMAHDHYQKANVFEQTMAHLLGIKDGPYCGCLSDEMVNGGDFDRGLEREGYALKPPAKKRQR